MPNATPLSLPLAADRVALGDALAAAFPDAATHSPELSRIRGGRAAALSRLERIDPPAYARTRNHLAGAVTKLSPYLRHGVIGLAAVREFALTRSGPAAAAKLVNELAWRDYFQRVYARIGSAIWNDLEPLKTGFTTADYAHELPPDIPASETGLACIDGFAKELRVTGSLHNHARMWLASYVVHHRRIRWQAGAAWFLTHLLDGDPASNNLSWQWVASTFSAKPYFVDRGNIERHSDGKYCQRCPLAKRGCPFDADLVNLQQKLFPKLEEGNLAGGAAGGKGGNGKPAPPKHAHRGGGLDSSYPLAPRERFHGSIEAPPTNLPGAAPPLPQNPIVWLHLESLATYSPAIAAAPHAPRVYVFDPEWIAAEKIGLKRIAFIAECLADHPGAVLLRGRADESLAKFCRNQGHDGILTLAPVSPDLRRTVDALRRMPGIAVTALEPEPFVKLGSRDEDALDLRRFSRYWQAVESRVLKAPRTASMGE